MDLYNMLIKQIITALISCGCLMLLSLFDNSALAKDDKHIERRHFEKAEDAFKRGHIHNYRRYKKKLLDYPLLPYLEYQEIIKAFTAKNADRAEIFLQAYSDTPLADKMRHKWLAHALKSKQVKLAERFYQANLTTQLDCQYLALLAGENLLSKAHYEQVDTLWLSYQSLPTVCNPIIKLWTKAGYRSHEKIWQRLVLAGNKGRIKLAKYLSTLLPKEEQHLGTLWQKLHANPASVAKHLAATNQHPKAFALYTYALKRLAWKKPLNAATIWQTTEDKSGFSSEQQSAIINTIAESLATKHQPTALAWLESQPKTLLDYTSKAWQIHYYCVHSNWQQALTHIEQLEEKSNPQWLYWKARALTELGANDQSIAIYRQVAKSRGYYGFLAAAILGQSGQLQHIPVLFPQMLLSSIEKFPTIARAKELYFLKRIVDARREWRLLKQQLPRQEFILAAGVIASKWGWHDRAIITLADAQYYDDINIRFPTPHIDAIKNYSEKYQVPPALALAVARQESTFMSDSRSGAGAMGLMQVMPRTAQAMSKRYKIKYPGKRHLIEPEKNIQLGTAYLNRLLRYKDNNIVAATAAYNAGPYRVKKWREKFVDLPEDVWIEIIPYNETRKYVKNVLTYQYIYSQKLQQDDQAFTFIVESLADL